MGLFSRTNPWDDPWWTDVAALAARAIETGLPAFGFPFNEKVRTKIILTKLGHLIYRMETHPCNGTSDAAQWYRNTVQQYMPRPLLVDRRARPLVGRLGDRLQWAIGEYVAHGGRLPDPDYFDRHVQMGASTELVLFGPAFYSIFSSRPSIGTPRGYLSALIDDYCWKQVFIY